MAMAGVAGFQVVIQKKQLLPASWNLDMHEKLSGRGTGDGSVQYVFRHGCPRAVAVASAIVVGSEGSNNVKKSAQKKGSAKAGRGEPVMAFRDQTAVCALASVTLERAVGSSPRSGAVMDGVPSQGRELSPAGDSATSLERSRLESQWTLFLGGSICRDLSELDGLLKGDYVDAEFDVSVAGSEDGEMIAKAVSSGRPSARLRRLEARQRRLSVTDKPSPLEAFMIHPPKRADSRNEKSGKSKNEGVQDYLSTYLRDITKIDRLTPEEEIMLSKKIRIGYLLKEEKKKFERALGHEICKDQWAAHLQIAVGDLDVKLHEAELARDRMVMANLRLVVSVVKQYNCDGLEVPDLIQEGSIGLLKGVEKFDHTRGYKLSTYVHWWIRQGVTRAIADHSRTVRLPVHVHDTLGRIRRTKARMLQEGAPATIQTLSEALNLSDNQVKNALKVPKKLKSLDMQVGHHKNVLTGDNETFHSLVADSDSENHPWAVVEKAHMKEDVDKMLNTQLGLREREIIKMHYGVDSQDGYPMSLESISHRYGVSRERVRQLERAAKRKLQTTNQGLDKYCCMSI